MSWVWGREGEGKGIGGKKRGTEGRPKYLFNDLLLQIERGAYDSDSVGFEVTAVRGERGVHRD